MVIDVTAEAFRTAEDPQAEAARHGLPHPERALHVAQLPARAGERADWPQWADPLLVSAWRRHGIESPWVHQARVAEAAWSGGHVVIATGTASGKSLAYHLPVLTRLRDGERALDGRGATALYIAPTKALAADQLVSVEALGDAAPRVATVDGDTPPEARRWARDHAGLVLTNPDMLHAHLLPQHARWAAFWRRLQFVVVDECHHYRGVFGSNVGAVLRRLRRVAAHYRSEPVFVLASATAADPAATASGLTGLDTFTPVVTDTSTRGRVTFVLWEPPQSPPQSPTQPLVRAPTVDDPGRPDGGQQSDDAPPIRRSALSETAELLGELVLGGRRTLAFVPSRQGTEIVATRAAEHVSRLEPALAGRIAAYRGGYLPEDRRALEGALHRGELLGLATTNALELGVDVSGLDAVVVCGWPGRRASLWQQAGRAGRGGDSALAVLVARDDPLDAFLVRHPEAIFGEPVEATVLDPENPYVLAPQLCAAAAELPLRPEELGLFGAGARSLVDAIVAQGAMRARPSGWFWTRPDRATDMVNLRGAGGEPCRVVDAGTGRVIGTVDAASVHRSVHPGAVYLHGGASWQVRELDPDDRCALVEPADGRVSTQARELVEIRIVNTLREQEWGACVLRTGLVDVTSHVVAFSRRAVPSGELLGHHPLDFPSRTLRTAAVWWTVPDAVVREAGLEPGDVPGSAHAAEHASIGLLPLFATCDRWDIGGVSTARHPDTGLLTVFVHDGHPGGSGHAERGFDAAAAWLTATRDTIAGCPCDTGCPACVQSPKCGNGNQPLDKRGARRLLDTLLSGAPRDPGQATDRPAGARGDDAPCRTRHGDGAGRPAG